MGYRIVYDESWVHDKHMLARRIGYSAVCFVVFMLTVFRFWPEGKAFVAGLLFRNMSENVSAFSEQTLCQVKENGLRFQSFFTIIKNFVFNSAG